MLVRGHSESLQGFPMETKHLTGNNSSFIWRGRQLSYALHYNTKSVAVVFFSNNYLNGSDYQENKYKFIEFHKLQ